MSTPERTRRPFSNGTEEGAWMELWCSWCTHDHAFHTDTGDGCELVLANLTTGAPDEWVDHEGSGTSHLPRRMECTSYAPCPHGDGGPQAVELRRFARGES